MTSPTSSLASSPLAPSPMTTSDELFFASGAFDQAEVEQMTRQALIDCDDGELFLEHRASEGLVFDDGRLKSSSYDLSQGFGLRSVIGERTGFAHASVLSIEALRRSVDAVTAVHGGHQGTLAAGPRGTNQQLYTSADPLLTPTFAEKVTLAQEIDAFARAADPRVVQVSVSLTGSWQAVQILRLDPDAAAQAITKAADIRPMVGVTVNVVLEQNGVRESGFAGVGGRTEFGPWIAADTWQDAVRKAIRTAEVNLEAEPAPAGTMPVVLGNGWPGVLLHEAVGHGLEGDFIRKKTSNFTELLGKQVAAKGVTVVDDGTIPDRRGSITIDDEGTPSAYNTLIEDGVLVGFMQDRQNARLMGVEPTGNGRRQSYAHQPMPRMTNTYMLSGSDTPEDILASLDDGLYAPNFGGGQVDITSGKFTFQCTEAYRVKNGKIGAPVKGATLIGNGPDVMKQISMIGNDSALDPGIGTCGKNGQGVPVGIGQPTLRIDAITVGGTA